MAGRFDWKIADNFVAVNLSSQTFQPLELRKTALA